MKGNWGRRLRESGGERVVLLSVEKLAGVSKRSANVLSAEPVFALHGVEVHTPSQRSNHDRHGRTRPSDHGAPVADLRIEHDSIVHRTSNSKRPRKASQGKPVA